MLHRDHVERLDQVGVIETNTITTTAKGNKTDSWATTYSGVKFAWKDPLMSQSKEIMEGHKPVAIQRRSAIMRKESRTITAKNMRLNIGSGSEYWYVEAVRPYKGSRNWLAVDVYWSDK